MKISTQFWLKVIRNSFLFLVLGMLTITATAQTDDPKASIAGLYKGSIKRADLLAVERIIPSTQNMVIVGFTISYPTGDDDLDELVSKSDKITPEMKENFGKLKAGTEISFENIKAKMADKTIILESVVLKLID
jgi:hypothetical protein